MNNEQLFTHSVLEGTNFRQQDLRGQSFKGRDLSGADFSGSDIRGANFTNAILRNANFSQTLNGLDRNRAAMFSVAMLLAAALIGMLAGFIGATIGLQFHTNALEVSAKAIAVLVHVSFLLIALRKGITAGFGVFTLAMAMAFVAALLHPLAIPVAGAIAIAIVIDFCVAALTIVAAMVAIVARVAIHAQVGWAVAATFCVAFVLALYQTHTAVSAMAIAATAMLLSAYVGWRTLRKRNSVRTLGRTLFARWGTSFRGADLTGANFSQALLNNADFRRAILNQTYWNERSIGLLEMF
ncbi:MAG: pentapeptide repeat-containing protein [Oscillatoriophycideae cyanobacterium NC_groundwater_1537_Pr4_S-0.65um_50_18]|nr:pentapeptide repeat-containing protein [Oscillatoriophycideae cyanobacterium NC_groundwater_1537_Pr4_S-0.65um_50_18]